MEPLSRRNFLKTAGLGTAGAILGVQHLSAKSLDGSSPAPAQGTKVRLAAIGIANRGAQIIDDFTRTGLCDIVALCDVDPENAESRKTIAKFPKAKLFKDFRKLFDEYADHFDAVCIAIPDFAHFPVAMLALHCGKHVYVEKPMARTFHECELLMAAARKHPELATQVGNQGHSEANYFQFKAWKDAGIIKDVYKIVAHHNDWRRWHPYDVNIKKFPEAEPLPPGMDWDTWLTTAQWHDYNGKYHPGNWRGWFDFGMGAIGDWAAHLIDTCHQFLELGLPYEIEPLKLTGANDFFFPQETTLRFKFGPRGDMPPVEMMWYDGQKNFPPLPAGYGPTTNNAADVPATNMDGTFTPSALSPGKIIYSKELTFKGGSHGATLEIIPKEKAAEMASRLPEVPKSPSNHFANFLLACQGLEKTRSPFELFGPMCQTFALGVVAIRTGRKLTFDAASKTIVNDPFANALLVGMPPRKGWEEYYTM